MAIGENKDITYFAETDFRNKKVPFGVKSLDRARHFYVVGKTGMGKSTLLENMTIQDINNGNGVGYMDPHGASAELFLDYIPKERIKDVIYFAPHDLDFPIAFNVMEDVGKDQRHLVANGLMAAFKKIWPDVWSARMEYISTNIILALLEYPNSTLLGVNRMLSDKVYRKKVVDNVTDPVVKSFWVDEFAKYSDKLMVEAGASIQNKFGQFVSNPLIRNIVGQPKSTFDMRQVMDGKKILIMNLSKGRMGELNANLIGGMLITKIYLAAMSRASATAAEQKSLPPFYFFVDEFQSFVNESFRDILSEARKYKLSLTLAHQYIEQVPEEVRDAVFGNVGTTVAFRVGPFDAEVLEKVFGPKFIAEDLVNLGFAQIYLTLMIDGVGSAPFSAKTLPPIPKPEFSSREDVVAHSRKTYARERKDVEDEIKRWHETVVSGVPVTPEVRVPFAVSTNSLGPFNHTTVRSNFKTPAVGQVMGQRPINSTFKPTSFNRAPFPITKISNGQGSVVQQGGTLKPLPNLQENLVRTSATVLPLVPVPNNILGKISLADLTKKNLVADSREKLNERNMSDLKSAIFEAMKSSNQGGVKKLEIKLETKQDEPKPAIEEATKEEQIKEEVETFKEHLIKEIPEPVLRKLLDIETSNGA